MSKTNIIKKTYLPIFARVKYENGANINRFKFARPYSFDS